MKLDREWKFHVCSSAHLSIVHTRKTITLVNVKKYLCAVRERAKTFRERVGTLSKRVNNNHVAV